MNVLLRCAAGAIVAVLSGGNALATEVMILGTYHMSNPGKDIHNLKADDVLVEKRQHELADVAAGLAKFKPTKVAVEQPVDNGAPTKLPRYHDYVDGKMADSRNEVAQVGYRLAKQMKLAEVWASTSTATSHSKPCRNSPKTDIRNWPNGSANSVPRSSACSRASRTR